MKQKFNLSIQKELANEPEVMALLDKFEKIKNEAKKKYPIFSWNDCEDCHSENQVHKKADIAIFMNMSQKGKPYPTLTIEWKEEEKKW